MKHLALLAALYALIAALVLPSSLLASQDADPATVDGLAAQTGPAEDAPAAPPEPAQPAPAPEQPRPALEPAATPEQPDATPAPADEPAATPAPTDEAAATTEPARERKDRTSARAAAGGSVTIADFQFTPAQITVDQGDTVSWTNNGPSAHSATAPDGSFDTGIIPAGQSRSHTFNEAGSFSYICSPHPNMHGTIVVRASQSGSDTPDSSTGASGGSGGSADSGSSGAEAAQSDGGPSLPNTGSDTGALLVLGALMLVLGVAVYRRARAEQQRAAGRIGW